MARLPHFASPIGGMICIGVMRPRYIDGASANVSAPCVTSPRKEHLPATANTLGHMVNLPMVGSPEDGGDPGLRSVVDAAGVRLEALPVAVAVVCGFDPLHGGNVPAELSDTQ